MNLKYVETIHATYLATDVFESVYAVHLRGAFPVEPGVIGCPDNTARDYVWKRLTGKLFDVTIFRESLESICSASMESHAASKLMEQLGSSKM